MANADVIGISELGFKTPASKNNSLCYTATNTIILKKKEVQRICVISHISETGELTTVVKTCIQEWQMLPSSVQ